MRLNDLVPHRRAPLLGRCAAAGALPNAWAALFACALFACGGDSSTPEATQAEAAAPGIVVLEDHTAGSACSSDEDCGPGTCRTEFAGNELLGSEVLAAPDGYCSFACGLNVDCGAGGVCVGARATPLTGTLAPNNDPNEKGQCLAGCDVTSQCRAGYRCVDLLGQMLTGDAPSEVSETAAGSCQVAPATDRLEGSIAGTACSSDADCGGGRCDTEDMHGAGSYPDGYCSGRCLQDTDCGDDGRCRQDLGEVVGACYRACSSDADCNRDGYRCRDVGPDGEMICQPGAKPLPDGVVGKACDDDAECGGTAMSCASQATYPSPLSFPDGYCSQSCVDSSDCGVGGACSLDLGAFKPGDRTGMCYKLCSDAGECRSGYECRILAVGGSETRPKVCALPLMTSMTSGGDDAGI